MLSTLKFFAFALLAIAVVALGSPGVADAGRPPQPRYLAAGDSITVGRRASDPATTAYVPLLAEYLESVLVPGNPRPGGHPGFGVINVAQLDDETTASMIADGQLAQAESILRTYNKNRSPQDDIQVVTFTIGGNDTRALLSYCLTATMEECEAAVGPALAQIQQNLQEIMSTLRDAAGPKTVISTMTYYNPLIGACTIPGPLGGLVPVVLANLNAIIANTAAAYGILVAPVAGAGIGPADLFGDCIHPNDSGYAKIAAAFQSTIGPALP
jgi:lysophospholipase L1-like esterase